MANVKALMRESSLAPGDRYYLKYLKMEVISKMQKHMGERRMGKN